MPCSCDGYPEPKPDLHNGPLAEALCKLMQEREASGDMQGIDAPTLAWWEEHKERDKARIEYELMQAEKQQKRQEALDRLTPFERKLLGLE
jgi:hypothetical protein